MTKQEEQKIIDAFQRTYTAFPEGVLVAPEPPLPDFVLTTSGRRIGIEITEVLHGEMPKARSSTQHRIADKLVRALSDVIGYRFTLDITLDRKKSVWKAKEVELIRDLTHLCIEEFRSLPDNTNASVEQIDFDFENADPSVIAIVRSKGYRSLPNGISRIRIHRYDGLPYSYNSQSEGGLVPNLTIDHFSHLLLKKERLLSRQPVLDENWLLIREGNYYTGTFDQVLIDQPIISTFAKVFLFRTGIPAVLELK